MSYCYTDPPPLLKAENMSVPIYYKTPFFLFFDQLSCAVAMCVCYLCLSTLGVDDGRETARLTQLSKQPAVCVC